MAVQDLTPQLRTRLGRLERLVGLFVTLATLLLLAGLTYYVYNVAQRKGWFRTKLPFYTFVESGVGLKLGDPVKLMGFNVGEITEIEAMPPDSPNNVIVKFYISEPHYGYVWSDSQVKIAATDFLGGRYLEVTKGGTSGQTNKLAAAYEQKSVAGKQTITGIWDQPRDGGGRPFFDKPGKFKPWKKGEGGYWMEMDEAPALTERLDVIVKQVERALPGFLALTNQLTHVLSNAATATAHLDEIMISAKPAVTNLQVITANIRDPKGSLGEWLLPTNMNQQITLLLTNANTMTTNVNTNLVAVVNNLNLSLASLASITSNLNAQVQANTNILTGISRLVVDTDNMVQGLKRHWLLRSAFKEETKGGTNEPPLKPVPPKGGGRTPN